MIHNDKVEDLGPSVNFPSVENTLGKLPYSIYVKLDENVEYSM